MRVGCFFFFVVAFGFIHQVVFNQCNPEDIHRGRSFSGNNLGRSSRITGFAVVTESLTSMSCCFFMLVLKLKLSVFMIPQLNYKSHLVCRLHSVVCSVLSPFCAWALTFAYLWKIICSYTVLLLRFRSVLWL